MTVTSDRLANASPSAVETGTVALRHMVLNDYQAVVACILAESASTENEEVRASLSRITERVHELADRLRRTS